MSKEIKVREKSVGYPIFEVREDEDGGFDVVKITCEYANHNNKDQAQRYADALSHNEEASHFGKMLVNKTKNKAEGLLVNPGWYANHKGDYELPEIDWKKI